jgi:hypothetical protein
MHAPNQIGCSFLPTRITSSLELPSPRITTSLNAPLTHSAARRAGRDENRRVRSKALDRRLPVRLGRNPNDRAVSVKGW